jgi:hypothetical protein
MLCVGGRSLASGGYTIAQCGTMGRVVREQRSEVGWTDSW